MQTRRVAVTIKALKNVSTYNVDDWLEFVGAQWGNMHYLDQREKKCKVQWSGKGGEGYMHYLHQYLIACTTLTVYFLYKCGKDVENHKPLLDF